MKRVLSFSVPFTQQEENPKLKMVDGEEYFLAINDGPPLPIGTVIGLRTKAEEVLDVCVIEGSRYHNKSDTFLMYVTIELADCDPEDLAATFKEIWTAEFPEQ